jgi:GNAT superfamily N-acetyltransferase
MIEMHATYYSASVGFGAKFEATVAGGIADFVPRLDKPVNQVWHVSLDGRIAGSIAIDGEDLGEHRAHLRWFILEDNLRGLGAGKRLMAEAMRFCDEQAFTETHLWTFKGLDAARALYERHGFELAEEYMGDQWGKQILEQRFLRARTLSPGTPNPGSRDGAQHAG